MMPDVSKLSIAERQVDDVSVLTLTGEMLLDDGDLEFRKCIHHLLHLGRIKIVLDLGGVTHIDSSGVGMLVAKLQTVRRHGGDIRLAHLTSRGLRLLGTMKILTVFETYDDLDSAVRSFASRATL